MLPCSPDKSHLTRGAAGNGEQVKAFSIMEITELERCDTSQNADQRKDSSGKKKCDSQTKNTKYHSSRLSMLV